MPGTDYLILWRGGWLGWPGGGGEERLGIFLQQEFFSVIKKNNL